MLAYALMPGANVRSGAFRSARTVADSLPSERDTLSSHDTLPTADTLRLHLSDSIRLTDLLRHAVVHKQLTVDSVLKSYSADSILSMLQSNRILEVKPDSSKMDKLRHDTVRKSKSALDQPAHYTAKDSITFDYANSKANLYGESTVNYQNLELTADYISMDIDSSIVHAVGRRDSLGNVNGQPVFTEPAYGCA